MEVARLQKELADLTTSLFHEGILDHQFLQLQELRDESSPDFASEVVSLFYDDAEKLINGITKALDKQNKYVDFRKINTNVHQLKGGSSSVGAQRVRDVCVVFRQCCEESALEGCISCLHQLKQEYNLVKSKLESLFNLEKQIVEAGGTLPGMEK